MNAIALSRHGALRRCGMAPADSASWNRLGQILLASQEPGLAQAAFAEASALVPHALDIALYAVEAATAAGTLPEALIRLDERCGAQPFNVTAHTARGVVLQRLGRHDAALDAFEVASALAPDAPLPARLLGGVLARSNRLREAEAALRHAHGLEPDNADIANDLATVLMRVHRHAEARSILLRLLEGSRKSVTVLCNLATATTCVGLQEEAVALAEEAIRLDPEAVLPWRTLCSSLPYLDGATGERLLAAAKACAERLPRGEKPSWSGLTRPSQANWKGMVGSRPTMTGGALSPLTVGLLSDSLRSHPVGWLTVAGFEALDPDEFHLICFGRDAGGSDPIAARFRAVAEQWIDTDGLSDAALAAHAREIGVDILIDLGGYGDSSRMLACAHRMAPVQIKWVGMQNHSTGLAEMDFFISDRWETPPELAHLYSERLLCLPDGYVCYSPPPYAPEVGPLPALRNGFVTFGCFNNIAKITPRVVQVWADILRRLPDARFVLKTHQFSDAATADWMRGRFAAAGIDPARIGLRGSSRHRDFMAEYNDIDIALDPFPYSSGLTTCEALWMGVPTVVYAGEIFASRHSLSHMCNVGLADWVTYEAETYTALAVAKASDVTGLADLRAGLRAQVKASPLTDAPRFGVNLAAALRFAWTTCTAC
jgi:predicted O-linked N-acetylglucosamine transferase (SPINDLY family)